MTEPAGRDGEGMSGREKREQRGPEKALMARWDAGVLQGA